MKNTSAILTIAIFFALFSSLNSNAQIIFGVKRYANESRLDMGVSVGMPTTYRFKSVIDADIRFQKDFSPTISGLLKIGFTYFLKSDAPVLSEFTGNTGFIPVKTGAKVFLTEKLYVSGEIGAGFRTNSFPSVSFIYSPAFGIELKKGLDLGLHYESFTKYNVSKVALKVAYGFRLKNKPKYTTWYN